jgi:TP901-1 family phage major tail protein
MPIMKGVDIILMANTGTDATPTWTVVGAQRGATLSIAAETIETTHKLSGGYKTFEYSFTEWTIEAEGVYVPDDTAYQRLRDALLNKEKIKVRWTEGGTDVYEGQVIVSSMEVEGAYDAEATYSLELTGTGAITKLEGGS